MIAGQGVLAIWNGIEPGHEADFVRWHVREHIPERVAIPGFLRARRYRAVRAHPAFFNFYEVAAPEVLASAQYLARLNDPSAWTRRVVPHFTDASRTPCRVVESGGGGVAGFVAALRFDCAAAALASVVPSLLASPEVSAVHLLARWESPVTATAESAMRAGRDETSRAILLVEGPSPDALDEAVSAVASDETLSHAGADAPIHRGLYQLDFVLDSPPAP